MEKLKDKYFAGQQVEFKPRNRRNKKKGTVQAVIEDNKSVSILSGSKWYFVSAKDVKPC